MSAALPELLCDVRCQVGESPLWDPAAQWLYWVDIEGRAVHRVDAAGRHRQWPVAERIGAIALQAGGGLLAAMETGLFLLQLQDDGTVGSRLWQPVAFPLPAMRFNDGRTDRQGRFWVSSMVRDMAAANPAGALYRADAGGLAPSSIDGLRTGNGLGFSPDGRVMYLSDSHPTVRQVWAFDLGDDGVPRHRRGFIDMRQHPGRPDGAAVDADGGYWICANDAGLVLRFTPNGRLDRQLAVPAAKVAMCAFFGPRLDRMVVTTIRPAAPIDGWDPALAGAVFVLDPGCVGLADTPFTAGG
ncbi:SMP-30/gluconolactonase/LRE family protein [Pseudaquabacterium pictum]|uniref:Gluconolactonase n=1 Tax=Pseudaquabacterium pictum TaxID=2315236 RepID=A0A480AMH9_9BURK|nr:SMP-30/gluconolactonase/LRE family protein [Rubrivivax pictus]GCL61577.1 gluconolactonase [Rubrivivax pictus]